MFGKKKLHYSDEDIRKLVKDSSLRHIAFIMDGNGRWATSRSLPREAGHAKAPPLLRMWCTYATISV